MILWSECVRTPFIGVGWVGVATPGDFVLSFFYRHDSKGTLKAVDPANRQGGLYRFKDAVGDTHRQTLDELLHGGSSYFAGALRLRSAAGPRHRHGGRVCTEKGHGTGLGAVGASSAHSSNYNRSWRVI